MSLGRATIDLDANAGPLDRSLSGAEQSVTRSASNMSNAMGGAGKSTDGFGAKLGNLSGGLTKTGGILTGAITLPMLAIGKNALTTAANYEKGMSVLQATSGASAAQMKSLGDEAKTLGADITLPGTSAVDAGQAMLELAKAGISVTDVMSGTRGVLELAAAGELSNADAAEIASNALNAFNLSGSETGRVADLLAASANASSASVADMAIAFKQSASVAAQLGIPIDDLTTALAEMANAGIKGSDAGTSVRTMLMRLAAPTDEAAGAMEDLGIETYDAQGNFKSLPDLISTVNGALSGLGEEQRNAALQTIFGADAIRAANVVLLGGADAYDTMHTSVTEVGAAQELAAAQTTGLAGSWMALQSTVETLALSAGEKLAPAFTAIANGITSVVGFLSGLNPTLLASAGAFIGIIAVAAPLAILLGVVGGAIAGLGAPILIVIGALALLGAAVVAAYRNWDTITANFPELQGALDGVKTAISEMGRVISAVLPGAAGLFIGYAKLVTAALQLVVGAIAGVGKAVFHFLTGDWGKLDDDIAGVGDAASRAADMAQHGFADMVEGGKQIVQGIKDVVSGEDLVRDAAEKAAQSTQKARTAANEYRESQTEAAASAAGLAAAQRGANVELERWDDLQSGIDRSVTMASDAVGYWGANLDETKTALGYLNDQIERGEPLSDKQQQQYDTLTQGAARQTAGMHEQEQGFVDAATAQVDFMNKQDLLNAALADGSINQDQYNAAVATAREEFNSAQGPAGELANSQSALASAFDKVLDKITLVLEKLGIIPPDVTTNLNVNGEKFFPNIKTAGDEIIQFSSTTGTATLDADADGATTAADTATGQINDFARGEYVATLDADPAAAGDAAAAAALDALQFAEHQYLAVLDADPSFAETESGKAAAAAIDFAQKKYQAILEANNADALSKIGAVDGAIAGLPSSFTIYAQLDYTAFDAGINHIAGYTPESPAKYGPLSKTPDWDYLVDDLPDTMDAGAGYVADGGAKMMLGLGDEIDGGNERIGERMRVAGEQHGRTYGERVRVGAAESLDESPTLGDLILAMVERNMDEIETAAAYTGSEFVDALVASVEAGNGNWVRSIREMDDAGITALAEMQTDLAGKIHLAEIAGEDTAELRAKLDAINQIIAQWAAQTGLDFQTTVNGILNLDAGTQDAVTKSWLDLLDNIEGIVSGDFISGLQDDLAHIQNELSVAYATGAPQTVIDALLAQQTEIESQLQQAGIAYQAALDAGLTDPAAWAKTQAELKQQITDTKSYFDSLSDGTAVGTATADMARIQQELAIARATGASAEVIDSIQTDFVNAQAAFNKAASDTAALIAAGLASPEAIAAYNAAMDIVTAIPVDQLLSIAPQMEDGGLSLISGLVDGIGSGTADYDDLWSLITEMGSAAMDELDSTVGASKEDIVAALEELKQSLLNDLAAALLDGSDPTAIQANLAVVNQALDQTAALADTAADAISNIGVQGGAFQGAGTFDPRAAAGGGDTAGADARQKMIDDLHKIADEWLVIKNAVSLARREVAVMIGVEIANLTDAVAGIAGVGTGVDWVNVIDPAGLVTAIDTILPQLADAGAGMLGSLVDAVDAGTLQLDDLLSYAATLSGDDAKAYANALIAQSQSLGQELVNALLAGTDPTDIQKQLDIVNQLLGTVQPAINDAYQGAQDAVQNAVTGGDVPNAAYKSGYDIGDGILEGVVDALADGSRGVEDASTETARTGADAFAAELGISSPSTVFYAYGGNMLTGLHDGLIAGSAASMPPAFSAVASDIDDELAPITAAMVPAGSDLMFAFQTGIVNGTPPVIEEISGMGDAVILGLTTAIADGESDLVDQMIATVQAAIDAANVVLGISSPSRVFHDIGTSVMEGLRLGIHDGLPMVANEIASVAGVMANWGGVGEGKIGASWAASFGKGGAGGLGHGAGLVMPGGIPSFGGAGGAHPHMLAYTAAGTVQNARAGSPAPDAVAAVGSGNRTTVNIDMGAAVHTVVVDSISRAVEALG